MKAIVWIVGIVVVLLVIGVWDPADEEDEGVGRFDIEVNCQRVVRNNLVSPGTMKVVGDDAAREGLDGQWFYDFSVDSQNAFGGLIRSRWNCRVVDEVVTVSQLD